VNPLSLHHLTVIDASPLELIDIASQTGCEQVCMFVHSSAPQLNFPLVEARHIDDVRAGLTSAGIDVYNLEFFPIGPDVDFEAYDRALRVGSAIGGRRATVHIHDLDEGRALRTFDRFCRLAGSHGLEVGLEFTAFARVSTLEAAVAFIEKSDQPNAAVAVDVLHLIRNGADPARLAQINPRRIGYMQICDGPLSIDQGDMMNEAVGERGVPGRGEFPLLAFLACAPEGVTIDVEVPQRTALLAGVSALDRAKRAVTATRVLMTTLTEDVH
jgi:sugar phosphate isomerase/epimerase